MQSIRVPLVRIVKPDQVRLIETTAPDMRPGHEPTSGGTNLEYRCGQARGLAADDDDRAAGRYRPDVGEWVRE